MPSFKNLSWLLPLAFSACGGRDLDNRGTISLDDDPALGAGTRRAIQPNTGGGGTGSSTGSNEGGTSGSTGLPGGTGPGGSPSGGAGGSAGASGGSSGQGGTAGVGGAAGGAPGGAAGAGGDAGGSFGGAGGVGGEGGAGGSGGASGSPLWLMIEEGTEGTLVNAREPSQVFSGLGLGQYPVWSASGRWMYQTVSGNIVFYDLRQYPLASVSYQVPGTLTDRPVWIGSGVFLPVQETTQATPAFMNLSGATAALSIMSNATNSLLGFASPDGARLGFSAYTGSGYDLYSTQLVNGVPTSTTFLFTVPGGSPALYGAWSADSRWALFSGDGTYLWNSGLSSAPVMINADVSPLRSFSPDGSLLLTHVGSTTDTLFVHDLRGATPGAAQAVHPGAGTGLSPGEWSLDGRFVTYFGASGGFITRILADGSPGTPQVLPGATYDCGVQWADDTTLVYATCADATPVINTYDVADDATITMTESQEWFGEGFLVSPDSECIVRWGQGALRIDTLTPSGSPSRIDVDLVQKVEWAPDSSGLAYVYSDSVADMTFVPIDDCSVDGDEVPLVGGLDAAASFQFLPPQPDP